MQPGRGQPPVRPMPLHGGAAPDWQQLLELARAGGVGAPRSSAFSSVPGGGAFPEFSLYNAAQLSGLLGPGGPAGGMLPQLPQLDPLAQLHAHGLGGPVAPGMLAPAPAAPVESSTTSRTSAGGGRAGGSRGDKGGSAYASRHQAAEQRRRTRINDRLERLRQVVPHSERANTATFLEEVIKYVEALQARVTQLETAQGLPISCVPQQKQAAIPASWSQPAVAPSPSAEAAPAAPGAAPAAAPEPCAAAAAAAPRCGQPGLPQPSGSQRDRPETPPQGHSQAEEGLAERGASAEPSEGSAPKRQRVERGAASPPSSSAPH